MSQTSYPNSSGGRSVDETQLQWIKEWIELHTGILFPAHKLPLLAQRLNALCIRMKFSNMAELVHSIQNTSSPALLRQVIEVATTNHTHFYREMGSVHYFREKIVSSFPEYESFRVWSAASSSGEELYTIIMAMAEIMDMTTIKQRYSFLGTDVNSNVIEQAEKAIYSSHRLTEVPEDAKKHWFRPIGLDNWAVAKDITELCLFRTLNLLNQPWPFANLFHTVFLRNVLYYFQQDTQEKILKQIYEVTLPGGWLITSVTESLNNLDVNWKRVEAGVYRKL